MPSLAVTVNLLGLGDDRRPAAVQHRNHCPTAAASPLAHSALIPAAYPSGGRVAGVKMGSGRPRRRCLHGPYEPAYQLGAGARPSLEGSRAVASSTPVRISVPVCPGRSTRPQAGDAAYTIYDRNGVFIEPAGGTGVYAPGGGQTVAESWVVSCSTRPSV